MQTCWPEDVAPLITGGLTVSRGPHKKRQNLGIYRQQVIARNQVITGLVRSSAIVVNSLATPPPTSDRTV